MHPAYFAAAPLVNAVRAAKGVRNMELSEVFYEAACLISEDVQNENCSCFAIEDALERSDLRGWSSEALLYQQMMANDEGDLWIYEVEDTASAIGWPPQDFRAFMLLMAAEAVK